MFHGKMSGRAPRAKLWPPGGAAPGAERTHSAAVVRPSEGNEVRAEDMQGVGVR